MKVGELIKDLRLKHRVSQSEFAKFCNVKQSAVSKWERGIVSPPTNIVEKLSIIFDLTENFKDKLKNEDNN